MPARHSTTTSRERALKRRCAASQECTVLSHVARLRSGRPVYESDPHLRTRQRQSLRLPRRTRELADNPSAWMPWNYLERTQPGRFHTRSTEVALADPPCANTPPSETGPSSRKSKRSALARRNANYANLCSLLHDGVKSMSCWCGVWIAGAGPSRIWFRHFRSCNISA